MSYWIDLDTMHGRDGGFNKPQRATNTDRPFEPGDIIDFCGDQYEVVANYGNSGKVRPLGETGTINFYWVFQGTAATLVKAVTAG